MAYRTDGSSALDDWDDSDFSDDSSVDDEWFAAGAGKIVQFPGSANSSKDSDRWGNKQAQRASAQKKARDGEDRAAGKLGKEGKGGSAGSAIDSAKNLSGANGNGIAAAKNAENSDSNEGFVNKVAGKAAAKSIPGGQFAVNKLKKMGPLGTILIVICACMGIFTISQSMAPFGLINNLMENYNSLKTSMNVRSKSSMMTRLIKGGKNTSLVKTSIFGKTNFKFSKKTQTKLASNGVYYDTNSRTLWYVDPSSGKTYGVSADESTKSTIPDSVDITDADGNVHHFDVDADGKMSYGDIMDTNDMFFGASERSTRTLKGQIAGWFDSISEKFHERIGNSRNRQKTTRLGATDAEIEANARPENSGGMSEEARDTGDRSVDTTQEGDDHKSSSESRQVDLDDPDIPDTKGSTGDLKKGMTVDETKTALTARAKSVAAALGTAANVLNIGSYACVAIKVVNSLIQTIQALSKAQVLNYGTGFFESIQKAESGDSSTEVHFYMNKATQLDEDGTTMFGSDAIAQAFADGKVRVGTDDPYAQKVSTVSISNYVMGGSGGFTGEVLAGLNSAFNGSSLKAYKGCVQLQAVSGVIGLAADIVSVAAGIMSGGIWSLVQSLLQSLLRSVALSAIIAGIMSIVTGTLVPYVAKLLVRDLISKDSSGALLGYAADSAANMYMGEQMQSATGLPGTETSVLAQYVETQNVIAEQARYERSVLSPFDVSSKYTFLGSIVNSLTPLAMSLATPTTIMTKLPSVIKNTTSVVGDSIASLMPNAQAMGVANFKTSLSHECGSLSNVIDPETGEELVCDAYGNPYFITRLDTMTQDAADVMDQVSTYINKTTIYHLVCTPSGCYDSPVTDYVEETNFERGYYGDWSNFPGQIQEMKEAGYYYRDSNYDGEYDMFYKYSDGAYRILRKEAGDDGESADTLNPVIREHSELANYIVSCEVRETGYGQEDSQISAYVNHESSSQSMGTLLNSLVGSLPIVGNLIQLHDTSIEANNVEWVSGENCLKPAFKLYSRYTEDQRLLEAAQIFKESAVATFLRGYYEENPIDNTYEGIIARYSGMSREDVDVVLGIVEYTDFVANYDATEHGPSWGDKEPDVQYVYDSMTIIADPLPSGMETKYVIYDTLQNRVTIG